MKVGKKLGRWAARGGPTFEKVEETVDEADFSNHV